MNDDDEARIRQMLGEVAESYRSKDAGGIVRRDAPGIVSYDLAPPLRLRAGDRADIGGGREVDMSTAAGVRTWLEGFGDAPFEYENDELEVAVSGDVAYAHCLARMGSPGTFSLWYRLTLGLRKIDGEWVIAHRHASVPFYMDETSRAATDLTP